MNLQGRKDFFPKQNLSKVHQLNFLLNFRCRKPKLSFAFENKLKILNKYLYFFDLNVENEAFS